MKRNIFPSSRSPPPEQLAQGRRRINWAWRRQATLGFSSGNNQINASNQVINGGDGWRKVCWEGGVGWGYSYSDVASSMADVRYCWLDDLCHRSCHAVISQIGAVIYIDATLPQSLTPNLNVETFKIMTSHFWGDTATTCTWFFFFCPFSLLSFYELTAVDWLISSIHFNTLPEERSGLRGVTLVAGGGHWSP